MADETMQAQPVALDTVEHRKNLRMLLENSDGASSRVALDLLDEIDRLNDPRAIIRAFAAAMEGKLAVNDGVKGGWRAESHRDLLRHLHAEVAELEAAVMAIVRDVATEDTLAYEGDAGDDYRCVFCGGHFDWGDGEQHSIPTREQLSDVPRALVHTPDCPVTKARALLSEGE